MDAKVHTSRAKRESKRIYSLWESFQDYIGLNIRNGLITIIIAIFLGLIAAFFTPTVTYGQSAQSNPDSNEAALQGMISEDKFTIQWKTSASSKGSKVPQLSTVLTVQGSEGHKAIYRLKHSSPVEFFHYSYLKRIAHALDFFRRPENARNLLEVNFYDVADAKFLLDSYLDLEDKDRQLISADISQWLDEKRFVMLIIEETNEANSTKDRSSKGNLSKGLAIALNEDAISFFSDKVITKNNKQKNKALAKTIAALVAASDGESISSEAIDEARNAKAYIGVPLRVEDSTLKSVDTYTFKSMLKK